MKIDEKLSEELDIENSKQVEIIPPQPKEKSMVVAAPISDNTASDIKADYDHARQTYRNLIQAGEKALGELTEIAKETEHPRTYEVLATMIKTLAETADSLFELQKKNREVTSPRRGAPDNVTVERAVFVGTTADLLTKIKQKESE